MLFRYKFVSKMLAGLDHVLEIGCGDGFGARIVAQAVNRVTRNRLRFCFPEPVDWAIDILLANVGGWPGILDVG